MSVSHRETQEIRMLAMYLLKLPRQTLEQRFAEENIDLTMLQHHIMVMAQRHQPTNAELSRMFGLDPSTLVPTVDALVKKGYLRRERDPNDRRRYPLYLTEEGQSLHAHICDNVGDSPLYTAIQTLSNEDVSALTHILRQLVSALPEGDTALAELDEQIDAHEIEHDR